MLPFSASSFAKASAVGSLSYGGQVGGQVASQKLCDFPILGKKSEKSSKGWKKALRMGFGLCYKMPQGALK